MSDAEDGDDAADRFEAFLSADGVSFTAEDVALLRAIGDHGSVRAAANELGRSRSRALDRLQTLESTYGPLVERVRGGTGGGGSRLTENGRRMLSRFARLRAALSGTAAAAESVLTGRVTAGVGELVMVETPAGTIRALLVDESGRPVAGDGGDAMNAVGSTVQVSLRADALTLHAPSDVPPTAATSARNRIRGTVTNLSRGVEVVTVAIDVGASDPVLALVTTESVTKLGLEPGADVVATFKATATRATARS